MFSVPSYRSAFSLDISTSTRRKKIVVPLLALMLVLWASLLPLCLCLCLCSCRSLNVTRPLSNNARGKSYLFWNTLVRLDEPKALWLRSKRTFKLTLVFELDCANTPAVSFLFSCKVFDARNSFPGRDEKQARHGLFARSGPLSVSKCEQAEYCTSSGWHQTYSHGYNLYFCQVVVSKHLHMHLWERDAVSFLRTQHDGHIPVRPLMASRMACFRPARKTPRKKKTSSIFSLKVSRYSTANRSAGGKAWQRNL